MQVISRETVLQAEDAFQRWCIEKQPRGGRDHLRIAFLSGWMVRNEQDVPKEEPADARTG